MQAFKSLQNPPGRTFLMCCFALLLFSQKSAATHVAAADLYMDYIGTGPGHLKYKVTLVLYRACEWDSITTPPFWIPNATLGGTAGGNTTDGITFSSSCGPSITRTFTQEGQRDTLDQLCANFAPINSCRVPGSVWPAFERVRYTDTITLPVACTDWKVRYSLCCRNNQIDNLLNPGGARMYIEAGINNVARWNNSTPRFIIDPIPYLCQGQPSFFLNGPLDPNNDSLVTMNVQPLTGNSNAPGTPITYNAGYSLANPIASPPTNPYTVNQNTGTATFLAANQGKYVLAFECRDYDRATGTELSYVRRDVQVAVLPCSASPPGIDSPKNAINITQIGEYFIGCPGAQISFEIDGQSNTISNSVYLSSTNSIVIPASNFTVAGQGTASPVGTFTWTPTGADIGDYTLIFEAKDSTCNNNQPIVLKNYYVMFLKILPGVDAGPDGRICQIDPVPWQINVTGPPSAIYQWSALGGGPPLGLSDPTIPNPTAKPPYDMTYLVEATNFTSACKNRDTISVLIDTSNRVIASPDVVICRPGYVQLDAQGYGFAPLQNLPCGTQQTLTCLDEDTVVIGSQYNAAAPATVTQMPLFTPFPGHRTARMQILIPKFDLYKQFVRSGTINGLAFEVNTPTNTQFHNFTIALKCTNNDELKLDLGGMENGATLVYTSPAPFTVPTGWMHFKFDTPYSWDSTKNLIVEICYNNSAPGTAALVTGQNLGMANVTGKSQMAISYTNAGTGGICNSSSLAGVTTSFLSYRPNVQLNYCPADTVPFPYTWTPGNYLSDSIAKAPLAFIAEDTRFYVSTYGRNGCKVIDSVDVKLPVHEYSVWPLDTAICKGEAFKLISAGDYANVAWFEDTTLADVPAAYAPALTVDCDDCSEAVARPEVSTNYYAVMTDERGCSDTMIVRAAVKPLPQVNILNPDTTIRYGQRLQLSVSGAYLYSWQPIASLSNPNVVNPIASPKEPTRYYVYGVAENGCRNIDSVFLNIDYRDQLFVPSAFTPNGDGKNDVFKLANITFQRLLEFRVFNRWGQEIYSTTEPAAGWDGTWKGVPQDINVYQYQIRVGYPDGFVETYKGNVTLIR